MGHDFDEHTVTVVVETDKPTFATLVSALRDESGGAHARLFIEVTDDVALKIVPEPY